MTSSLRRLLKAHGGGPLGITPRKKKEKDPKPSPSRTLEQDVLSFMLSDPEELKVFQSLTLEELADIKIEEIEKHLEMNSKLDGATRRKLLQMKEHNELQQALDKEKELQLQQ